MLIVKYESKNFFGINTFHEDEKENETFADVKKAFQFLKKNYFNAIQIDNIVITWNAISDFENGILLQRTYDGTVHGYTDVNVSYDKCKKFFYELYKNKEAW